MKQGAINRTRLVNAAADLFWRNGYDGTSLADIAKAANIPVGNIYYYYKSKTALADDVGDLIRQETEAALAGIDRAQHASGDRLVGLIDLLSASNEARVAHGCPIARSTLEFRAKAPLAADRSAQAFKTIENWLEQRLLDAGHRSAEAKSKAIDWLSRWQGAIIVAHATGRLSLLNETMSALRNDAAAASSHNASPLSNRG